MDGGTSEEVRRGTGRERLVRRREGGARGLVLESWKKLGQRGFERGTKTGLTRHSRHRDRFEAARSGNMDTAWQASSAAAGSLMLLDQAIAELRRITHAPKPPS